MIKWGGSRQWRFWQLDPTAATKCNHCNNTDARLETARKHALNKHGDTQRRMVKLTTQNPWWEQDGETRTMGPPSRSQTKDRDSLQNQHTQIWWQPHQQDQAKKNNMLTGLVHSNNNGWSLMILTDKQSTIRRLLRLKTMKELEGSPTLATSTITQDKRGSPTLSTSTITQVKRKENSDYEPINKVNGVLYISKNSLAKTTLYLNNTYLTSCSINTVYNLLFCFP